MSIALRSVAFRQDGAAAGPAAGGAIALRVNAFEPVLLPEWVAGRPVNYPAAYAIDATALTPLFITATFTGTPGAVYEVTALAASTDSLLGPTGPGLLRIGDDGRGGPVRLPLPWGRVARRGVGAHEQRWVWVQRTPGSSSFSVCGDSVHRIYTLLSTPTLPWVQQPLHPANVQLPWAEVLEWACTWAAGSYDVHGAASAIALALFARTAGVLQYNCLFGGPTNYADPAFDCTALLERLAGGPGRGPNVNCSDCATIVSTFANALGCSLWQARMFNPLLPFAINPVRLIGQPWFGPACGSGYFNYHEVAWDSWCSEADSVYDASLAVQAPAWPHPPVLALVPTDLRFGWAGSGQYRDLLVAPGSRLVCQPQPSTRMRRPVY